MIRAASDVSAVVLTIGEPNTARAIRSVHDQTLAAREIVVVDREVRPFHRALNLAASRVCTPFFVQVDADMVLDPFCFAAFRGLVAHDVGIVSGFLRDPLLGRVCCVKLFRTECFERCPMPDTISPDTDFRDAIYRNGWKLIRALRFDDRGPGRWHTFGEHRPDYSPQYTFAKFMLEGRRVRYRRDPAGLRDRLARLHARRDEIAIIAQIALGHGIFIAESRDLLRPFAESTDWRFLCEFLRAGNGHGEPPAATLSADAGGRESFRDAYRLGFELRQTGNAAAFRAEMHALGESRGASAWIAHVGLCHGLFAADGRGDAGEDRYRVLGEMIEQ